MSYENKIAHLTEVHVALEKQLGDALVDGQPDSVIVELKKKKLRSKDLIRVLTQLDNQGCEFK